MSQNFIDPVDRNPPKDSVNYSKDKDNIERRPPNAAKDFRNVLDDERQGEKVRGEKKIAKKVPGSLSEEIEIERDVAEASDEEIDSPLNMFKAQSRQQASKIRKIPTSIPMPDDEYGAEMVAQGDEPGTLLNMEQVQKKQTDAANRDVTRIAKESTSRSFALEALAEQEVIAGTKEKVSIKKEKSTSNVLKDEDQDIATINPYNLKTMTTTAEVGEATGTVKAQSNINLKELVEHITNKLYTLESEGKKETIIEIKNLPMFDGARVVVTSFTSATKEFNLAFENLTQAAKQLIDNNMLSLRTHLEEKGFANAIHIVTTTTQIEHRIPEDATTNLAREEERQQQNRRQRQEPEEDEAEA